MKLFLLLNDTLHGMMLAFLSILDTKLMYYTGEQLGYQGRIRHLLAQPDW